MGFLLHSQIHTLPIFLPGSPNPGGPSGPWRRQHAALFGLLRLFEVEPAPWAKCRENLRRSMRGSPEKTPPKNRPKKDGHNGHIHQSLAYFKHILATLSHIKCPESWMICPTLCRSIGPGDPGDPRSEFTEVGLGDECIQQWALEAHCRAPWEHLEHLGDFQWPAMKCHEVPSGDLT